MKKTASALSLVLTILVCNLQAAQEVYDSYNIRQKAMGGTQVTALKDSTSFYQNPAFLALEKSFKFRLPRAEFSINSDFLDKQSTLDTLMNSSKEEDQIKALKALVPMNIGMSFSSMPLLAFTKNHFGLIGYSEGKIAGGLKRKTNPTISLQGNISTTFQMGLATSLYVKKTKTPLYLGLSPKYTLRRTLYNKTTGKDTFMLTQSKLLKHINNIENQELDFYETAGFGLDFGALYPYKTKRGAGHYGLTIKNLIAGLNGTKKVSEKEHDVSYRDPLIMTVGWSTAYKVPYIQTFHLAADYNLIAPTQSFLKRIHLGVEKRLTPILALRGGLNQGFVVGGFGIDIFVVKLDYACFTEEYSKTLGQNPVTTHHLQFAILL